MKTGTNVGQYELYAMMADIAAQERDEAALRQYAPLAEEAANTHGHRLYQAVAHRAWGVAKRLAGEPVEAEARLQNALSVFQQLDTRWQMGRTLFELGELARTQKNVNEARAYFARALALFEEMQAAPDSERTRNELESLA